jgi:tetratricopeptide (TPR) repeat protein
MLRTVITHALLLAAALSAEPASATSSTPVAAPAAAAPTPAAANPPPAPVSTAAAAASSATAPPASAASQLAAALARADAAYAVRDEPMKLVESQAALGTAMELAPDDYGVLWRLARHEAWRSEDPSIAEKRKSELGKKAWDLAERAITASPGRVEGWFYAVSGIGNYSLGIGILSALAKGLEGKFKDRLSRAEQLDPAYDKGAIPTAWGRFWYELPWPKHDAKKSEAALRAALAQNPDNVRAHVYLGDLHLDEGRKAEARAEYQAALAKPAGQYDGPEERRWQGVARTSLEKLERK